MADLRVVYQQFATGDPMVNGLAGNWSDNCEKLRGTIRALDGYMAIAANRGSRPAYVPLAARPAADS
jgi:hypothetical protein